MTTGEYNESVNLYADNIYRFILKNIKDQDKAKDIVQDTYEKLWLRVETVSYEKARSYLFTTAYHTMIDMLRRDAKQSSMESVSPSEYSHSEQYSDLHEVLNQAIQLLPEAQRSVIMLRDYEGYSYEEIAEITGLSISQVKVYIFRGRIFLKEYIGKVETVL